MGGTTRAPHIAAAPDLEAVSEPHRNVAGRATARSFGGTKQAGEKPGVVALDQQLIRLESDLAGHARTERHRSDLTARLNLDHTAAYHHLPGIACIDQRSASNGRPSRTSAA
jgi:hypothetical protein